VRAIHALSGSSDVSSSVRDIPATGHMPSPQLCFVSERDRIRDLRAMGPHRMVPQNARHASRKSCRETF
jgi:hypothetical protein